MNTENQDQVQTMNFQSFSSEGSSEFAFLHKFQALSRQLMKSCFRLGTCTLLNVRFYCGFVVLDKKGVNCACRL